MLSLGCAPTSDSLVWVMYQNTKVPVLVLGCETTMDCLVWDVYQPMIVPVPPMLAE